MVAFCETVNHLKPNASTVLCTALSTAFRHCKITFRKGCGLDHNDSYDYDTIAAIYLQNLLHSDFMEIS